MRGDAIGTAFVVFSHKSDQKLLAMFVLFLGQCRGTVKVIIEIPIEIYYLCLTRFSVTSREYQLLKNGIITHNDRGEEVVEILCEAENSRSFRQAIISVCPEAAGRIKERPDT